MQNPKRPEISDDDDLSRAIDIDINSTIQTFVEQRELWPIIRPSKADDVAAMLNISPPEGGDALGPLIGQLAAATARYPRRNTHPGFFGWIAPSGVGTDPLAHALVAALNENLGGYWSSPVGTTIEKTVIGWLTELVGLPDQSEGILISGGSLGNMTGIASALADKFGPDYRKKGLNAFSGASQPVIICSQAAHFSIRRAAAMLGIGTDNVVAVETDGEFRMRLDKVADALEQHRNIVCVVASAGTTNTGAIDPLEEISRLCKKHKVWFHVDAAYGGGGLMSEKLKPRYKGIDSADSVVLDLHKWFYQSLDGSALIYRDADAARKLFFESSDYLRSDEDRAPEKYMAFHLTPELSRRFRALPFYIALRHYGLERLGRNALHNVQCAEYLADLIRSEKELELVTAPQLSILTYRYSKPGLSDTETDQLNSAIRDQIQEEGNYLMSATEVNGRPVLRVCVLNHTTRAEHMEGLIDSVLRIGREFTGNG